MASRAKIDERGRLHIPTAERERASIPLDSDVLVVPKSPGHIELILVGEARLEQFQKNIRGRLKTLEGRRTQSRQSPSGIDDEAEAR